MYCGDNKIFHEIIDEIKDENKHRFVLSTHNRRKKKDLSILVFLVELENMILYMCMTFIKLITIVIELVHYRVVGNLSDISM